MAAPTPAKISHTQLPTVVSQKVVVVSNATNDQKSGVVNSIQGNYAFVVGDRTQFYIPIAELGTEYLYTTL